MLLIGPTAFLPALRLRVGDEHAVCASDADAPLMRALIERHRPSVIVFERIFATTPRGAALMNELMQTPELDGIELRVMAHDEDYLHVVRQGAALGQGAAPGPATAPTTTADAAPEPPARTVEFPIRDDLAVQIDGKPVALVDLSGSGAQVIAGTVLRPNQVVRVSIASGDRTLRVAATIAWSAFEMSRETGRPHYRAEVTFHETDVTAIERLCRQYTS